ncbi:unnamed protein product [Durusdinium trenchii]|uniref:Uncharacterized protein n=2 Tax=Durusdinium trenchii TaxID=1381693 RepID=A0ABP0N9U4_9DINO
MTLGLQWIVDRITFPSPPSSYSLTSHPELFFLPTRGKPSNHPGVPCMLYAIRQGAPVLLVHAHSNGCDIGDMRQTLQSISESLKVHVMSFEFPGYGLHLGNANMRSIDDAASTVLHYIAHDLKINLEQVVWYGRSIGSGPALRSVHRISQELNQQPGGVVLQCGFANFPEVAGHLFGRLAKRLVNRLWPNEAMLKDLKCPVLLIHGRNDTMIPITQSEKLWEAVHLKELSHFHICDCGHNDFNFRRCTLRPIYDFLLGVISHPSFPATNFQIELDSSRRALVRHIGPLRGRIPVYSFRRPELEDWLLRIGGQLDGPKGSSFETQKSLANEEQVKREDTNTTGKFEGRELKSPPSGLQSPPGKRARAKSKVEKQLLVPDYSIMPHIEDIEKAFCDPEGMVRTCAARVSQFLQRLQRQLARIEGLEHRTVDEIVDFVEAEFWACDPLLCLWEEVSLPTGDHVRYRFGPFCIDHQGHRSFQPNFDSSSQFLRVPLWIFAPSQAHFRCLTEWSLVHSDRLRQLPSSGEGTGSCGGCCCVPGGFRRKPDKRRSKAGQPTMGSLSTSLAAHFANWVEKNEDIKGMFERFAQLYNDPDETLRKSAAMDPYASLKTLPGDTSSPTSPMSSDKEEGPCPPNSLAGSIIPESKAEEPKVTPPGKFSAGCRQWLLQDSGNQLQPFVELAMRMRFPGGPIVVETERQEGHALPNPADTRQTAEYVANPAAQVTIADRFTGWAAAGFILHYERLLEESQEDPLRPELRNAGFAVSKAVKAFASADLRARREQGNIAMRQRLDQLAANKDDGVPEPPPDYQEAEQAKGPTSVTPAMPTSHVEGL